MPTVKGLFRSVAIVASGTAASQIILLLASPLLTRLYTPQQFGLLAAYMAAVTILGAVSTLRFELVIPIPKRHDIAANALVLTLASVLATSLLCALLLAAFGQQLAVLFNASEMIGYGWLIPLGVLSMGTYVAFNNWAVRRRKFGIIARTKMSQSLAQTAIQIGAAFTPFATFGLLLGSLLGQSTGISSLASAFRAQDWNTVSRIRWRRLRFLTRHFWHFPVISLPASVAFSASQQAPALVLFSQFGAATAGFYLLAQRVGMMPATLLGTALSQSVYRDVADHRKSPSAIGALVQRPVRIMNSLVIAPACFFAVIAPGIVELLFGSDWTEAGHYLRWMAPWVAMTITFGAMSPIVSILGWQKMGLFFQVGSLAASLAAMMLSGTFGGPVAAIAGYSITKALCILAYRLDMFRRLGISPTSLLALIVAQSAGYLSIFVLAQWLVLKGWHQNSQPLLFSGICVGMIGAAISAARLLAVLRPS